MNRDDFLPYEEPPRKLKLRHFVPATAFFSLGIVASALSLLYYKLYYKRTHGPKVPRQQQQNEISMTNTATLLTSTDG